jgi:hypothetical protein
MPFQPIRFKPVDVARAEEAGPSPSQKLCGLPVCLYGSGWAQQTSTQPAAAVGAQAQAGVLGLTIGNGSLAVASDAFGNLLQEFVLKKISSGVKSYGAPKP